MACAEPASGGYLGYASELHSAAGSKGATVTQSVQDRVRDGVVATISASQVTAF